MEFTPDQIAAIREGILSGDDETPIETVFGFYPDITRDEAVDAVEKIEREWREELEATDREDRDDFYKNRRLTRQERLEGLADRGCDTWDEYHGRV